METIRAVERAIELLECFSNSRSEIGLSELSRLLGTPKATVFRLARTLLEKGYLMQDRERQTYRIGPKVVALSNVFLAKLDYRSEALPLMKELRDTIQESVSLYIPVNDQRMCVQRVNSNHSLRQFIEIGDRLPLNRGSGGKLLIAYMQLMQQDVDPGEIASILNKGYAVSIEEREQGVASVSAPVRNNKAEVIASLTISGSAFRFQSNNLQSYIYETVHTAKRISGLLGYQE